MLFFSLARGPRCLLSVWLPRIGVGGLLLLALAPVQADPDPPRVAVFSEPSFPAVNISALVSAKEVAADLHQAGISNDLLSADDLANPAKLNIQAYAAVVLPAGNAYPQAAFANLKTFHLAGGDLVTSGIPFTHAIRKNVNGDWEDAGNDDAPARFGAGGLGVGGYRNGVSGRTTVSQADPLGLSALKLPWGDGHDAQTLDPATLPAAENRPAPILVSGGSPLALLNTHSAAYHGAVDVWTPNSLRTDDALMAYAAAQLLARGAIAALASQGRLTPSQRSRAFASLNKLPRPRVDADLVLPDPLRPYPTLQPKSGPPVQHLLAADVRKLSHDEILLLASVQGIVNRRKPLIYLITNDDDKFWLDQMQKQGATATPVLVSDPLYLVKAFRWMLGGAVVPDPNIYVSPCLAVDLAGLSDLAIATPALAAQVGLPIKADLRGRFKDDADALQYARTVLLPQMNPHISLCLDPPLLGTQVDDIIASRGTCFWITGPKAQSKPGANEAAERAEIAKTFAQMPRFSVVRGFWWHGDGMGLDETPGVALASRYGKITTVSDYVANFSVTSGIPLQTLKQKPQPPAPAFDKTKVYLAITVSDGDNFAPWNGVFRSLFADPLLGTFPVAFGMGPSLIDVAPHEVRWYYDHAAPNNEFLCDVSGAGYIYPTEWAKALKDRPAQLQAFYGLTQSYLDRLDMHTVRLMNVSRADIADAGRALPGVPFLMPDYGLAGENGYPEYTYTLPTGQPVFRGASDGPAAATLAAELRDHAGPTRPAFLNAFVYLWGTHLSDLRQMLTLLGPDYVPVTPTQLNALYRESQKPSGQTP